MTSLAHVTVRVKPRNPPSAPPTCSYVPDFVQVRDSSIHGKGVFATCVLQPKRVLAKYSGEYLTAAQLADRYPPSRHPTYVLQVRSRFIDAAQRGGNWTRFLNDSHGTTLSNNCKFNQAGNVEVTRLIRGGEELLVSYGAGFWAWWERMQAKRAGRGKKPRGRPRRTQEDREHQRRCDEAKANRKARYAARQKRKASAPSERATRHSPRQRRV